MIKPLAAYKHPGDNADSVTISITGRSDQGDLLISISVDEDAITSSIQLTKWHFQQLIAAAEERLQQT